jgi:SAM-dependent MidA family methyltransferase
LPAPRRELTQVPESSKLVESVLPSTLTEALVGRIRREGRITFHDWMEAALYHPQWGYYNRSDRQRWGRGGDYRTSPERSELFAATFVRYFATIYEQLDHPSHLTIVEIGAGDGQFALDVLQQLEIRFPEVFTVVSYVVDEKSEDARCRVSEKLERFGSRVKLASLEQLEPIDMGIVFSNELFDAFPVHRVTSSDSELKELYVAINDEGAFGWVSGEMSSDRLVEYCRQQVAQFVEGQVVDVNLRISDWFQTVNQKLKRGAVISVDYGAEAAALYEVPQRRLGTLRAFRRHSFVDDVLAAPGEYDITSSVDWTYVKTEGSKYGFEVDEFDQLDKFLLRTGVLDELEHRLNSATTEADRSRLTTAAREMILPTGMAASFQVLVQRKG